MLVLNEIAAIIVLLSLSQLYSANAATKFYEQSYSYPGKQVMYNSFSFKDGNLVYAVCDGTATEKICTVVQHQLPYDKVTRSCNITLKVEHPENVNLTDKISVYAFGQENAILLWGEIGPRATFNLMAIQLDSCKTKMLQLDDPDQSFLHQQISSHKLLTYDKNFDIFFEGIKSSDASSRKQVGFRMSFDNETQPIFDIINISEDERVGFMSPIATRSPDKGYVYSSMKYDSNAFWLVKPDGTKKLLMDHLNFLAFISAAYNSITIGQLSRIDDQTVCTQFNEDGEVKFNITLGHDDKTATLVQFAHNSPRGGFILMTATLERSYEKEGVKSERQPSFNVMRVDGEGKKVGSIRLNGFDEVYDNTITYSMWENGDEYCAASINEESRGTWPRDNLSIVVNCFTENDFTA